MKSLTYAFYPGCVSRGGCPELYPAAMMVAEKLGLKMQELPAVGCTGAGVLPIGISDPINARTFAKAEQLGLPIMSICSTCQGVMSQANHRLKSDPDYRARINQEHLAEEGLEYKGTTDIKHLLWVIMEDYGIEEFKKLVVQPLTGVKLAPFYGCLLRRPDIMEPPEFSGRKRYLEDMIEAVGAEVTDFAGKGKCCGFPIVSSNLENSLAMSGGWTSEAKSKGADAMVTPCPLCHLSLDGNQLRAAGYKHTTINLPVLHLPQAIGLSIGFSPKELQLSRHIVSTKPVEKKVKAAAKR